MKPAGRIRRRSFSRALRDLVWVLIAVLGVALQQLAVEELYGDWPYKLELALLATGAVGAAVLVWLLVVLAFRRQPAMIRRLQKDFSQRYARALETSPFNPAYSQNQ